MQTLQNAMQSYQVIPNDNNMVEIPVGLWKEIAQLNQEMKKEFDEVQSQWMEQHDIQNEDNQRQRSKNRHYKKKFKALENQSSLYMRDQKEFEQSLIDMTKVHDKNKSQFGQVLDQMENQVSQLKKTVVDLRSREERQLEEAFTEMVNFYANLEKDQINEYSETDSMNIDRCFFINPTEKTQLKLQKSTSEYRDQRGRSELGISHRELSVEGVNLRDGIRAKSSNQKSPLDIPPLPIDKINETNSYFHDLSNPAIIPNFQNKNSAKDHKFKESNKNADIDKISPKPNEQKPQAVEEGVDFITNPVLVNAMPNMVSEFQNHMEDDYDGANVTLDMNTERLLQFPGVVDDLQKIEDPDQRIICKQMIFMRYERILRQQAKVEKRRIRRELKEKKAKEAAEAAMKREEVKIDKFDNNLEIKPIKNIGRVEGSVVSNPDANYGSVNAYINNPADGSYNPTPTNQSAYNNINLNKGYNCSSRGSLNANGIQPQSSASSLAGAAFGRRGLVREREDNEITQIFSVQSELPPLNNTEEVMLAKERYKPTDVNGSDLYNVQEELAIGLQTATQTSLVMKYQEEFRLRELQRENIKGDERKLNYSASSQSRRSLIENRISQASQISKAFNNKQQNPNSGNNTNKAPIFIAESDQSIISYQNKKSNSKGANTGSVDSQNTSICHKNSDHTNEEHKIQQALRKYEIYNKLPKGSATLEQVKATSAGIDGFAKWTPQDGFESQQNPSSKKGTFNQNNEAIDQIQQLSRAFQDDPSVQFSHQQSQNIDNIENSNFKQLHYNNQQCKSQKEFLSVDESLISLPSQLKQLGEQENYCEASPSLSNQQIQNSYYQNSNSYAHSDNNQSMNEQPQVYQNMHQYNHNVSNVDKINYQNFVDQKMLSPNQIELEQDQNIQDKMNNEIKNIRQQLPQQLPLDVIQERQSEFSQSMITNAARLNTNRSRQSINNKNMNHYTNGSMIVNKGSGALPSGRSGSDVNQSGKRVKTSRAGTGHLSGQGHNQSQLQDQSHQLNKQKSTSFTEIEDHRANIMRNNSSQAQTSRNVDGQNIQIFQQQHICIDGSQKQSRNSKKKSSQTSQEKNGNFKKNSDEILNDDLQKRNIPPLGKKDNRQMMYHNLKNERACANNYVNSTQNNSQSQMNSEREHLIQQQQNQQPRSHRSHIGARDESIRDRSYFDESPAVFENVNDSNQCIDGNEIPQQISIGESVQIEESQQPSNVNIHDIYNGTEDSMLHLKLNSGIQGSNSRMQIHSSNPSGSVPISSRMSNNRELSAHLDQQIAMGTLKTHSRSNEEEGLEQIDEINIENSVSKMPIQLQSGQNDKQIQDKPQKPLSGMIRSNSECLLRDKEFYEMQDEDDEIAMYCKLAEQNIIDGLHIRNLSQHKNQNIHHQISDNSTAGQFFIQNANKSSSISTHNQLVQFMSHQTFNRLCGKYLQTQDKSYNMMTNSNVDQNSSQQQTKSKALFQRFYCDPNKLMASNNMTCNGPNQQNINQYLGTNFLTNSLDDGTFMQHQIMMPTHQYNRRTLLMMQNLHNNYLYSNNSGILFTMQRGWNGVQGVSNGNHAVTNPHIGIGQSFENLQNIGRIHKDFLNKNNESGVMNGITGINLTQSSQNVPNQHQFGMKMYSTNQNNADIQSLGGEPVNITNYISQAKQPSATDKINVGCISIIDDDGKYMIDRKLLLDAGNSSHQTKARRLFLQSRIINGTQGQQTVSDFSNLQTKQLSIFRSNYNALQQLNMNKNTIQRNADIDGPHNISYTQNNYISGSDKLNEPFADYKDDATVITQHDPRIITPSPDISQVEIKDNSKIQEIDKQKKINSHPQQKILVPNQGTTASGQQPSRIQNLMVGINRLQIQKKNQNKQQSMKSGSSLSQVGSQDQLNKNYVSKIQVVQQNFQTQSNQEMKTPLESAGIKLNKYDSEGASGQAGDYDSQQAIQDNSNFGSLKGAQTKKTQFAGQGKLAGKMNLQNIKQILKQNQLKNLNLSQSIPSNNISMNSGIGSGVGLIQKQLIDENGQRNNSHIKFKNLNNIVKLKSKSQTRGNSGNIQSNSHTNNIVRPQTQMIEQTNTVVPSEKIRILKNDQTRNVDDSQNMAINNQPFENIEHKQSLKTIQQEDLQLGNMLGKNQFSQGNGSKSIQQINNSAGFNQNKVQRVGSLPQQNNFMMKKGSLPTNHSKLTINQLQIMNNHQLKGENVVSSARNSSKGGLRQEKLNGAQFNNQVNTANNLTVGQNQGNTNSQQVISTAGKMGLKKKVALQCFQSQQKQIKMNDSTVSKQQNLKHLQNQMKNIGLQ